MKRIVIRLTGLVSVCAVMLLSGCYDSPTADNDFFLKYFGQDGFQTCVDAEVDAAGNFYLLGTSGTSVTDQETSIFLVKADPSGNVVWKQTIAPAVFQNEVSGFEPRDLELLQDGSRFIVAGNVRYSNIPQRDIFAARFECSTGSLIDRQIITPKDPAESSNPYDDEAFSVTEINNGDGYIIAGYSRGITPSAIPAHETDGIHIRLRNDGLAIVPRTEWIQIQGFGVTNVETKVVQVADGQFYSFGYASPSNGSADINFVAVEIKDDGNTNGFVSAAPGVFGDTQNNERLGSVSKLTNGINTSYYMIGVSSRPAVVSTSQIFGTALTQSVNGSDVQLTASAMLGLPNYDLKTFGSSYTSSAMSASGGILVLTNEAVSDDRNWFLMKLATDGTPLWNEGLSFGGDGNDFAGSVRELPNGKIIISGTFSLNGESKMVLMKLNSAGHLAE